MPPKKTKSSSPSKPITSPHRNKKAFLGGGILLFLVMMGIIIKTSYTPLSSGKADDSYGTYQKISADSSLHISFEREMDKADVKKNIESSEPMEGDMTWSGNTMILKPDKTLEEGKTYWLRVKRGAKFASGEPTNKDMEFRFVVAGPPLLSSHFPETDATEIKTDAVIRMVFDRPMVPLTTAQGTGSDRYSHWPVTINPAVDGTWRWLGTSAVEFKPMREWDPATTYQVSVPKGLVSLIGDKTTEDFSWTFTTQRPFFVSSDLMGETARANPSGPFSLSFSQPIDLESASAKIRIFERNEDKKGAVVELSMKHGMDETSIEITPRSNLGLKKSYLLEIEKDLKGKRGKLGSEMEFTLPFTTAGELEVTSGKMEEWGSLKFIFSNPIEDDSLKGAITIHPEVEDWDKNQFQTDSWSENMELAFYPNLKPSTTYTVTIGTQVKDQFGQNLKTPYPLTFTTAALSPSVNVVSKGEFGIFERGRPPIYPIDVVNVSRVNAEFARIPFNEFLKIQDQQKSFWDHKPNLSQYLNYKSASLVAKNKLNEWETLFFDMERETGIKPVAGLYAISVQSPEYKNQEGLPHVIHQYFALTDTALTLKYSGEKALVWAVDMRTGNPAKNVNITFYNLRGEAKLKGVTDAQGLFETPLDLKQFVTNNNDWSPEFWVTGTNAEGDFSFVGSNWNGGMDAWNFGLSEEFRGPQNKDFLDGYLYTERQVYRPGDTVNFKGILRLRDKSGRSRLPEKNLQALITINDAQYNEVFSKTFTVNEFGSFSGSFPVAKEATLGNYWMNIQMIPDDATDNNYLGHSFAVLAYRKPEYKVEITPEKTDYFSGEAVKFAVNGSYYFGAPMSGAKVHYWAKTADYFFNRYTDGWYSFALEDAWCWWDCSPSESIVTEGDGELDDQGGFEVSFPLNMSDKSVSQIVTLEADLTDENNQVVSNRASVPVHQSEVYVGVSPEDYVVLPGEKARIKVITVNPQGEPVSNQKVKLSLFSREWNTIKKKSVDGQYYYENEPKDTFIRDLSVSTEKDGKVTGEILVDSGGQYRVVAETKDTKGRESKAGTELYVFSSTYINWPHGNDNRIDVVADKPEYAVGDIAKLLIKSPWQGEGVKALITVEREEVITYKIIDIKSNAQSIDVPITDDLIPNAYVSAIIIKPRDGQTFDENGKDTGVPAFRMGYTKLKVETERKKLRVNIGTNKEKYGPGETVTVNLSITDHAGTPMSAEISLGVVDLSVQALLGFRMPDLIQSFYGQRGLGVKTSEMLTYLIELFKPGSKGGGGGDPDSKERSDFKDTAYWNPSIVTNTEGKATVSFSLPDNLTTWQLLAIAHTKDNLYGASVKEVIETKKVILRPVRPRFAVVNDEIQLGAIVHNFTDSQKVFKVSLTGSGFELNSGEKTMTLAPDAQEKVSFPVKVTPSESLTLHFKAETDGAVDEIEEVLPVYRFGTPQSVATSGVVTDESALEKLFIPSAQEAKEGTLNTIISPTLASYLPKGLEYLVHFPYGCAEQTASSFLPNVVLASLSGLGAITGMNEVALENHIITGLTQLYSFQHADGGFGYFHGSPRSYPYLSAYITHALVLTQQSGYSVDSDVISRAKTYLKSILRGQNLEDRLELSERAYLLYVLAEIGDRDQNLLNNLFEKRKDLPLFAKAYLGMAYGSSNEKANTLLSEIKNEVKLDSRGAHFEEKDESLWAKTMNTNTRTTALALQFITRMTPGETDLSPKIIRHLLVVREEGHWDTTQSTVTTLLALTEYLKATEELEGDFTGKVSLNGTSVLEKKFSKTDGNVLTRESVSKAFDDLKRNDLSTITFEKAGIGRLYYDLTMDYFLTLDALPPAEQGIGITKEISPIGKDMEPVKDTLKTGETYKVKLTLTVPQDRHFVAVSSPLPAGLEAIDFTLNTSQQRLQNEVNQPQGTEESDSEYQYDYGFDPLWYFTHTEFRDDSVFLFADYLPAGIYEYEYLVRATLPGKFLTRPTRIWEMYFPETFGQTEGGWIEVKE